MIMLVILEQVFYPLPPNAPAAGGFLQPHGKTRGLDGWKMARASRRAGIAGWRGFSK